MRDAHRSTKHMRNFSKSARFGSLDGAHSFLGVRNKTSSAKQVSLDAVSVRRATNKDKEAVLNIDRNIYFGQDFLPYFYERYTNCRYTTCLVAELNNTVVGFLAHTLIDKGEAVLTRGARVMRSYQGLGILRALVLETIRRNKNKKVVSTLSNTDILGSGFISRSYSNVLKRQVHGFEIELKLEKFKVDKGYEMVVSRVNKEDLKWIFMAKPLIQYLFPNDRIVISWMSFKPTLSNVPLLFWHNDVMFSSLKDSGKLDANDNGKGLLTSSSCFFISNSQWVCNIDVFGNDILDLKSHFLAHLNSLGNSARSGDKICLYFCSEVGLPLAKYIKDLLEGYGVTFLNPTKQTTRLCELHVIEWNVTEEEFIKSIP